MPASQEATATQNWWTDPKDCRGGSGDGYGQAIYSGEVGRDLETIAIVKIPPPIFGADNIYDAEAVETEWRRRANVMAAAPQLLDAVEKAWRFMTIPTSGYKSYLIEDLAAAIAAATGAQP